MEKIRKGDEVVVIAGKDKGRRGAISKVFANGRVLVENAELRTFDEEALIGEATRELRRLLLRVG